MSAHSPDALSVKNRFDQTCREAGVEGSLAIDVGEVTRKICERAVLTDLIVLKLTTPPSSGISALGSPYRTIIGNSSRPLLTIPEQATHFKRALLAYDGTDRSREALFVATYLAEMWKTGLVDRCWSYPSGVRKRSFVAPFRKDWLSITNRKF
jgi:hypothetical protein